MHIAQLSHIIILIKDKKGGTKMKGYLLLLVAMKNPAMDIDELILELRKMSEEDQLRTLELLAGVEYGL